MNKVIILEDEFQVSTMLNLVIGMSGFETELYHDTTSLIDNIDTLRDACVLISDFDLPDGNALAVYAAMKANNIDTPVILNSANSGCLETIKNHGYGDMIVGDFAKTATNKEIKSALEKYRK